MPDMKKLISLTIAFAMFLAPAASSQKVVDVYDVTITLSVPRVYDNTSSMGYRKYQRQQITGEMVVTYDCLGEPSVTLRGLVNKTHKISGSGVRYGETECEFVRWHYIGDNKRDQFKTPSVSFYAEIDPSYNISQKVDEDNSLLLTFSGTGVSTLSKSMRGFSGARTVSRLRGYATGTIGCGCYAYGHVSPTRVAGPFGPLNVVPDVASVFGRWTAKFNKAKSQ
jgi:hypothetical protein